MYLSSTYQISPDSSLIYYQYISATNPKPQGEGLGAKRVQAMPINIRATMEVTLIPTMALSL
jgi:hypothetical protein